MTYIEFVCDRVKQYDIATPIYNNKIAEKLALEFNLSEKEALMATAVAIKRIMDTGIIPELCFYKKGIYYRTEKTFFGNVGINKELLIRDKYINNNTGYETGLFLLYKLGLTTQIPNKRVIVTNAAKECTRNDNNLGVTIKPPKTAINANNKQYLQILDALEIMDKAPVDAEKPYAIIANYISKQKLAYHKLLALANDYYNKNTIMALANTASVGDV